MGQLKAHIVDKNGVSISGTVFAKKGSEVRTCQASVGMCSLTLPAGQWTVTAKTPGGSKGGPNTKAVPSEGSVSTTIQVFTASTPTYTAAITPKNLFAPRSRRSTVPFRAKSLGNLPNSGIVRIGGLGMSAGQWVAVESIPGITDLNQLSWTPITDGSIPELSELGEVIVKDVVKEGEDVTEATAIALNADVKYVLHEDVVYALAVENQSGYVNMWKLDYYGQMRAAHALAGAVLGGIAGWLVGDRFKGQAIMGAAVGVAGGTGLGYLIGKARSK